MKIAFQYCLLCAVLSACSSSQNSSEKTGSEATQLYSRHEIDNRRRFEDAVVGHELRGDGVDVTVAPDGALIGTHLGKPFLGSWEYRRDRFCVSMTSDDPRNAVDRRCFRAAIDGRAVILHPVAAE